MIFRNKLEIEIYTKILEMFPDEEKYNKLSPYFGDAARNVVEYIVNKFNLKFAPTHDELLNMPYIEMSEVTTVKTYNHIYGDRRICECGHSYYRHFDPYNNMDPVGCKYCGCFDFKEKRNSDKL